MKTRNAVWIALLLVVVGLSVVAACLPYLPGDVALARVMQSLLPEPTRWAGPLSSTAKPPLVWIVVAVTFGLSWAVAGRRAALLSLISIGGMWLLGWAMGSVISQPRPDPALIHVSGSFGGSAFPSQFALRYAATLGFLGVLAALRAAGAVRWAMVALCACLLLAGPSARVAVGAHWPSDIAISYLIGFLWVALLLRAVPRVPSREGVSVPDRTSVPDGESA
jgi:undecaprenyl-diphosphatase